MDLERSLSAIKYLDLRRCSLPCSLFSYLFEPHGGYVPQNETGLYPHVSITMTFLEPYYLPIAAAATGLLVGALLTWLFQRRRIRMLREEIEQQRTQLVNQTETINRLNYEVATALVHKHSGRLDENKEGHVQQLQERLEQKDLELQIVRQDYELETKLLKQELGHTREQLEEDRSALMQGRVSVERARDMLARQSERLEALQQTLGNRKRDLTAATPLPYSPTPIAVPRLGHFTPQEPSADTIDVAEEPARKEVPTAEVRPTFVSLHSLLEDTSVNTSVPILVGSSSYDDLTQIWGIDEQTQAILYDEGLTSYGAIANLTPARIEVLSQRVEQDARQIQRHWIAQAQLLQYSTR